MQGKYFYFLHWTHVTHCFTFSRQSLMRISSGRSAGSNLEWYPCTSCSSCFVRLCGYVVNWVRSCSVNFISFLLPAIFNLHKQGGIHQWMKEQLLKLAPQPRYMLFKRHHKKATSDNSLLRFLFYLPRSPSRQLFQTS